MIFGLFGKRENRRAPADALFARVAEASRNPQIFLAGGIPDTFEGRFESLALHVFLLLRRLRDLPAPAADLAQDVVDACFAYLELGFRQGGISDISVPKRMKKIGRSFYGRIQAYDAALDGADPQDLVLALQRNASPGEGGVMLASYARASLSGLSRQDLETLLAGGEPLFPAFESVEANHGV